MNKIKLFKLQFICICMLFCYLFLTGCKKQVTLDIPTNCSISDDEILSWDSVSNSTKYKVIMSYNDSIKEFETKENYLDIFELTNNYGTYNFEVMAYGDGDKYLDSGNSIKTSFTVNDYSDCFEAEYLDKARRQVKLSIKDESQVTGKLIIPDYYDRRPVIYFVNGSNLGITTLYINDNITKIVSFRNCSNLTRVRLSKNIKSLYDETFALCTKLKEINIEYIENITGDVFLDDTSLQKVKIGKNLNYFSGNCFGGCTSLSEVIIDSDNENYYFESGCIIKKENKHIVSALESVIIPNDVVGIDINAFRGLRIKEITIPSNVSEINKCFYEMPNLETITLSEGITSIDNLCFDCPNLTTVNLPSTLESISIKAFEECPVRVFNFKNGSNKYDFVTGCLIDKNKNELVYGTFDITIPDYVISIGEEAFMNSPITDFVVPSQIEVIGEKAFYESSIVNLEFNTTNLAIKNDAFGYCYDLNHFVLKDGLYEIGERAFYHCSKIEYVVIPKSVKKIGNASFCYCFASIILYDTYDAIGVSPFITDCVYTDVKSTVKEISFDINNDCIKRYFYTRKGEHLDYVNPRWAIFYDCTIENDMVMSWKVCKYTDSSNKDFWNYYYKTTYDNQSDNDNGIYSILEKVFELVPEIPHKDGYTFLGFTKVEGETDSNYLVKTMNYQHSLLTQSIKSVLINKENKIVFTDNDKANFVDGTVFYANWSRNE